MALKTTSDLFLAENTPAPEAAAAGIKAGCQLAETCSKLVKRSAAPVARDGA